MGFKQLLITLANQIQPDFKKILTLVAITDWQTFKQSKLKNNDGKHLLILICLINENECKIITVIDSSKIHKYL